ncbi:MAG: PaaI family thioesterase, partial [Acidimicrobiia bacterium]|nr:PaaI family thioesterase [Acidimicrobiia bacterium]
MAELVHPEVADSAADLDRLVGLIRRLALAAVTHQGSAEATAALADEVHRVADLLEAAGVPLQTRYAGSADGRYDPANLFVFDCVFGRFNPLALPVVPRWNDPIAEAEATFTPLFEGPPGGVHGAVMAACFDQMCNVANIGRGVAGFTVDLEVRYHRLTRVGQPVRFTARVESVEGRRVVTQAEARQGDDVTASANG